MMKKTSVKELCIAGIFAAVIFVTTAYLHIPSHTGYTHVGDTFVYLAACFLSTPYAMLAGAVGGVLSDVLSGFAVWAPGTAIIKAATAFCFSAKGGKILTPRNFAALIAADVLCIGGYYLYDALITGNFTVPLLGISGYVVQSLLSNILFIVIGFVLDRQKKRAS